MTTTHIVALSGGKDSSAMALRLAEVEPREYIYVCTPTGNEHDDMIEHWKSLSDRLGQPILPLTAGRSLQGEIRRQQMLPNHRARWCTRMLKIEPYQQFLAKYAHEGPVVSYVGLRADEPERPGGIYDHLPNVTMRFPMREWGWGIRAVTDYLRERNVTIPKRTDCLGCFWQRLGQWWELWKDAPEEYEKMAALERYVTEQRGRVHTFRSEQRDSWPASLHELRARFEAGARPKAAGQGELFGGPEHRCRVCSL